MTHFCVALIGGIGSGKTTAANFFSEFGVKVINADVIAKKLTETMSVKLAIQNVFGKAVFDSNFNLNRKKLGSVIFSDTEKKGQLENIIHPLVRDEISREIQQSTAPYCLLEIPVFDDRSAYPYCQLVLCISSNVTLQTTHIISRDNRTKIEIEKIMANQLTDEQRRKLADDVITNIGTLDDLKKQCFAMHKKYLEKALLSSSPIN